MPRAARECQMMAAAEEIFAERGYMAASMDEIAERVGVSKPMIYEYFGSKEGLLVACLRAVRAELQAAVAAAVARANSAEDAMRRGLVAFFVFADEHRRSWDVMLRTEAAIVGKAASLEIEAARQGQIALHIEQISAYLPDLDPLVTEASAEVIVGACERLSIWYVRHDEVTPEQAAEYAMQMIWFGMRSHDAD